MYVWTVRPFQKGVRKGVSSHISSIFSKVAGSPEHIRRISASANGSPGSGSFTWRAKNFGHLSSKPFATTLSLYLLSSDLRVHNSFLILERFDCSLVVTCVGMAKCKAMRRTGTESEHKEL